MEFGIWVSKSTSSPPRCMPPPCSVPRNRSSSPLSIVGSASYTSCLLTSSAALQFGCARGPESSLQCTDVGNTASSASEWPGRSISGTTITPREDAARRTFRTSSFQRQVGVSVRMHTVASEIMAGNGCREGGGRGGQENLRVASRSKMGALKGACKSNGVDQGGGKGSVEKH